tara:strand:- start:786 stop:1031 length:246 start_codon:yes stop_codon:yes gene_type:complete
VTEDQRSGADQQPQVQQQPVVIRQGSSGLATVVAALLIAGSLIYAINVWSTTKKETAPGRNLERGIERLKEAAGAAMEKNR